MTALTGAVLFCSESKGSGFHANECPQVLFISVEHRKQFSANEDLME